MVGRRHYNPPGTPEGVNHLETVDVDSVPADMTQVVPLGTVSAKTVEPISVGEQGQHGAYTNPIGVSAHGREANDLPAKIKKQKKTTPPKERRK